MFLVKSGSLTIVARTPREAMRIRERLADRADSTVQVTDMDGHAIAVEVLAAEIDRDQ